MLSRRVFMQQSSALSALAAGHGLSLDTVLPPAWLKLAEMANTPAALTSAALTNDDEQFWQLVKQQFFIEDGLTYLNSGTYGPTLRAAYEAATKNLQAMGANYIKTFRATMMGEAVPQFMAKLAAFAGTLPDELALTSGTTEAMNYLANGLDWQAGDELVTTRHEHQGGIYPWLLQAKRHGLVVKQVELATPTVTTADILERIQKALTPRTRVLSFSHVNYTDGTLMPARELCQMARQRGILSVVDGAQSLGMLDFKISELGCDFFAGSWHKWMCAPYGTGVLYVNNAVRDRLWPTLALSFSGWDTRDRDGNDVGATDITYAGNYPKALLKYSSNIEYYGALYWTIAHVVDFQTLLGRARVTARIKALAERAYAGLSALPGVQLYSPRTASLRTGLISFRAERVPTDQLYYRMRDENRIIGRFIRHPGIQFDVNRFAPNVFNTVAEIDAAVQAVKEKNQR